MAEKKFQSNCLQAKEIDFAPKNMNISKYQKSFHDIPNGFQRL